MSFFNPPANSNHGYNDDVNTGYNARMHSKLAEREGFHLGNGSDEPRTLYVGNLDSTVTEDFIATLFNQIGSVTKTKVIFDEMKVNWAVEPGQQQSKIDTTRHFHVFVGDLSSEVDNQKLREAFQPFGDVSDAKVIRDTNTTKSKGYGFVSYPKREEAERAIEQMNGQWLGRRTIRTNWATRKPGDQEKPSHYNEKSYDEIYNQTSGDNTSVYVGNIASLTEDEIRQGFASFGRITEVRIFKMQGYAFVKFDNKDAAAKAIVQMNNQDVGGQLVRCSWGKTGDTGKTPGGSYGYGYGNSSSGGNSQPYSGYGGGGAYGGGQGGGGHGGPGQQQSNANSQYWQYYAQYYNNPQLMQQWSNYWQQQGGAPQQQNSGGHQ
ncbi:RRM domain-containing protein [Caenorhabditis elegans]|uniref:RRM domain-containing protein n=1 Tax=Caenorhabditis elegans TaxID=6239 RepID=Q95QV7_CAEEL|nr:RRM domain-containing protein [Caenorhabditis elegans]CCD65016.1 RRM domain-containing protein [Caenorhabditis elegans]|eukprot:NP_495120.1 TIA-1/TIAL RNA binding protein homolog [Caenorhabditis elegans]